MHTVMGQPFKATIDNHRKFQAENTQNPTVKDTESDDKDMGFKEDNLLEEGFFPG